LNSVYPHTTADIGRKRRELTLDQQAAFEAFSKAVFADGALPAKIKQIIAVAVAHVCPLDADARNAGRRGGETKGQLRFITGDIAVQDRRTLGRDRKRHGSLAIYKCWRSLSGALCHAVYIYCLHLGSGLGVSRLREGELEYTFREKFSGALPTIVGAKRVLNHVQSSHHCRPGRDC
jgi:hypothetical protein